MSSRSSIMALGKGISKVNFQGVSQGVSRLEEDFQHCPQGSLL